MLARQLKIGLVLELLIWLALGLCGVALFDWSPIMLPAIVLGGMFALRVLIVVGTFAFSIAWGAAPPDDLRLGFFASFRLLLKEISAFLLMFCVLQPFERYWMRVDRLDRALPGRTPVLLVHGYGCNRGTWGRMARALRRAGWPVATVNLEPARGSIDQFAAQLAKRIDQVLLETGADKVILLGHSMGGLVARQYVARFGDTAVRAIICLGSPHHGTRIARLGLGQCARDMEPGSAFLAKLPLSISVPLISIYSAHDNFIMPQGPCRVPGARNVAMAGVGHIHMVLSQRVTNHVLRELAGV